MGLVVVAIPAGIGLFYCLRARIMQIQSHLHRLTMNSGRWPMQVETAASFPFVEDRQQSRWNPTSFSPSSRQEYLLPRDVRFSDLLQQDLTANQAPARHRILLMPEEHPQEGAQLEDLLPEASEAAEEAEAEADLPIQATAQAQNGAPDAMTSTASELTLAAKPAMDSAVQSAAPPAMPLVPVIPGHPRPLVPVEPASMPLVPVRGVNMRPGMRLQDDAQAQDLLDVYNAGSFRLPTARSRLQDALPPPGSRIVFHDPSHRKLVVHRRF